MTEAEAPTGGITTEELVRGWRNAGVRDGMVVMVHSSLSSLGTVDGGAATVVNSLRAAVGASGTIVVPAFTRDVSDPYPHSVGVPGEDVRAGRNAVRLWHTDLPSSMGAIPEATRVLPEAVRSSHPQASVVAVGPHASFIAQDHGLEFATGADSPFGRMYELDAHILLIGVGHNRNTFLHHVEGLTPHPRLKVRRFPLHINTERVWVETLDVGDDNDTYFPMLGSEFERATGITPVTVGQAPCRLVPAKPFVRFAVPRLTELLAENTDARA